MRVRIVIDSTADLAESLKSRFTVVPLSVNFGTESFIDGVTIDHQQFYEKLVTGDVMPTTSQPTPDSFAKVYQEAMDAGEEVVVLTIASKLSGTYQSATIAAMDFPEGRIHIVDTETVTIGAGILAERALELADSGKSAAEIAAALNEEKKQVHLVALLDTLEYLKRGGRISKTVAFAGGLLSIKPVIGIGDGEINMLGKARGAKQGFSMLTQLVEQAGGIDSNRPVLLGYTGQSDAQMQKYAAENADMLVKADRTVIGSVVGTHAGPGAFAVAFFAK